MAHGDQGDALLTAPWAALGPLVLASASPRRAELLAAAGARFEVLPADVDERQLPDEPAAVLVERLSREKALALAGRRSQGTVLGGDTVVVLDGRVLGKPVDVADARAMLAALAGREHDVLSGVALVHVDSGQVRSGAACTRVCMDALDEQQLAAYLDSGEWEGKAGAYAIQGLAGAFTRVSEGDWDNVVGLPVALVERLAQHLAEELP